jgi:hypothetical protein
MPGASKTARLVAASLAAREKKTGQVLACPVKQFFGSAVQEP